MALAKRNILTNLLSSAWVTVLTAVITPLQVNLLGIESYALIGFIATLQVVFAALDLGLSSTLTREIASDTSTARGHSAALIETASTVYWGLAIVIGLSLAAAAGVIASHWFQSAELDSEVIRNGLYLITLFLAVRWPIALYSGILAGVSRIDVVNYVKIATSTLRLVGGMIVILIWRDIQFFLAWMAFTALIEVLSYYVASRRICTFARWRFRISLPAIQRVWRFSAGMGAISILALLISQLDRILVSRLLPLATLGYYNLAYSIAAVSMLATAAISSAMLPHFAAVQADPTGAPLLTRYDLANRILLFVIGLATFPLMFFSEPILTLWVGSEAGSQAAATAAILAVGFWLSALYSNAYGVAVAVGRPRLPLKISLLSAVPYAVLLYLMTTRFGLEGTAGAWVILTASYSVTLIPEVHRTILRTPVWQLARQAAFFASAGVLSFGLCKALTLIVPAAPPAFALLMLGFALVLYVGLGYWLLGARIRAEILAVFVRKRPG